MPNKTRDLLLETKVKELEGTIQKMEQRRTELEIPRYTPQDIDRVLPDRSIDPRKKIGWLLPEYTTSKVTEDRTFNADSTTTAELADILGTLIADLTEAGLLK